ncbi:MAG: Rrf2 family transcriptional regulator [Rickettsiales bacterium]|nr:Rrf2 family transcriptional regulator [Rickettsiales bacterium]
MLLTSKGRYAVMALVDIAMQVKQSDNDFSKIISLADISERQNITIPYLEQIFSKLKNAGIVKSSRGPGGGYSLAKPANEIHISEIINAVDDKIKMVRCNSEENSGCLATKAKCATHDLWDNLENYVDGFFQKISLTDVIEKRFGNCG